MSRNKIEIKDGITIKSFASHLNYVTENSIYEKLGSSGLAPELIYSGQDSIEHVFVEGPLLFDILVKSVEDEEAMKEAFGAFFKWYRKFLDITGQTLGNIDFRKFVLGPSGLVCLDFEHCKVGYVESDLAKLISQMYLVPRPFAEEAKAVCLLFISCAMESFNLNAATLSAEIKKELARVCKLLKIFYDPKASDELCKAAEQLIG